MSRRRSRLPDDAVVAHLQGGLGNQLFQYAAVGTAARRAQRPLLLDVSSLGGQRPYALGHFDLAAEVVPPSLARYVPRPDSPAPWRRAPRTVNRVVQRGLGFGPQLDDLPPRAWVSGYWQSPLYFAERRDEFRGVLSVESVQLSARAQRVLDRIQAAGPTTVAVHVRRGDYTTDPATTAAHGVLGVEHFRRALCVARSDGADVPVVFSDDIQWAREHLGWRSAIWIEPSVGCDHEDLLLMAACARHVLSNSSFSWWGAWLGRGGLVVAPARWTRTLGLDVETLLPPEWVRLDVEECP